MRGLVALALCLGVAACGVTPGTPLPMGANEMQTRPGLFSGPTGDVLLVGSDSEQPPAD